MTLKKKRPNRETISATFERNQLKRKIYAILKWSIYSIWKIEKFYLNLEVQGCTRLSPILSFTHVCLKCEPLTHKNKLVAPLHGCLPSLASSSSLDIWSQISLCCGSVSSNLKVGSLNPKKNKTKRANYGSRFIYLWI